MSSSVTSFCRSTKHLAWRFGFAGMLQIVRGAVLISLGLLGASDASPSPKPVACAAAAPARKPSVRQPATENVPLAAPTEHSAWTDAPGMKIAFSWS
jgi:hypothetical protein